MDQLEVQDKDLKKENLITNSFNLLMCSFSYTKGRKPAFASIYARHFTPMFLQFFKKPYGPGDVIVLQGN